MSSGTVIGVVIYIYLAAFCLLILAEILENKWMAKSVVFWVAAGGFAFHANGIFIRWGESYAQGIGHVPLSNFYESLVFFSWATMLIALLGVGEQAREKVLAFVLPVAILMLGYASLSPGVEDGIQSLAPALKSNWLAIHVITCFLGYASFFVASVSGIFLLRRKGCLPGRNPLGDTFSRCVTIGFIFFTVGILTGSVWAQTAWGRYWGWDPKETWALITWLIYAAVIHERIRGGGVTRRVAGLSVTGLASVLFTYFGVNCLPGLHRYL